MPLVSPHLAFRKTRCSLSVSSPWMGSANRAIRILAQLEFAKLHAQGVDQQQTSDQRLARAQNQLDGFRRLHHADQSGQNAQHSTFRAGRHQSRRWRLGIQAAIARPFFGGENAGLAFKAEDRAINVWLAGEHAGIIHQITRGKIVCSVHNDVKVGKDSSAFWLVRRVSKVFTFT